MSGIKGKSGIYTRTEKMREKMKKIRKGKFVGGDAGFQKGNHPKTEFRKGQTPWNKGRKCPDISERQRGEKNWNWQGGITPMNKKIWRSIEMRLWRESVFARDSWTCQKCGERREKLRAHHIRNFAECLELRTSIENGITFCDKCHREFHRRYGRKNNTKEQINNYLNL